MLLIDEVSLGPLDPVAPSSASKVGEHERMPTEAMTLESARGADGKLKLQPEALLFDGIGFFLWNAKRWPRFGHCCFQRDQPNRGPAAVFFSD